MRGDFFGKQQTGDVMTPVRAHYKGVLIGNMGYTPAEAEAAEAIRSGKLDAVAFGTAFLANPDLPARIKAKRPAQRTRPQDLLHPGPRGLHRLSRSGRVKQRSAGCFHGSRRPVPASETSNGDGGLRHAARPPHT
jgi:hypothetical protein